MPLPRPADEVLRSAHADVYAYGIAEAARRRGISQSTLTNHCDLAVRHLGLPQWRRRARPNTAEAVCEMTREEHVTKGVFLAFGDAHWTDIGQERSVAHEALLRVAKAIQPDYLLSVGDLLDFSSVSRHDPVHWGAKTTVRQEIEACRKHLDDLSELAPNARRRWVRGNHDDRFDKVLARDAAAFEGMPGTMLRDVFPDWPMAWRYDFGAFQTMHRWHGGVHAAWNNVLKGGVSILSADGHVAQVRQHADFQGQRYGVQLPMLGDKRWPCFAYMLGNPRGWNEGFAVLTVQDGRLLQPELCEVLDGLAWFRGEHIAGRMRGRVKAGRVA